MANEEKTDSRSSCGWPVPVPVVPGHSLPAGAPTTQPCGSEERLFDLSRPNPDYGKPQGIYQGPDTREHVTEQICQRHLPEAWKAKDYHNAVPSGTPAKRA